MSWSLQVVNGDLAFAGNGLATVIGAAKLVQDLGCDILEPMGTDDSHPSYGSLLDGGVQPDGTTSLGVIGAINDATTAAFVNAEIQRICQWYQSQQSSRNAADVATYGKSTITADEALISVEAVDIQQVTDTMLVNITLQTGTGTQNVAIPVSASTTS